MKSWSLDTCFDDAAARVPQRPALCIGASVWTYAELLREKQRIADLLRRRQLDGAGRVVGLLCEKSLTAFAGLLGIMASGNTYLPLSPRLPDQRLFQMARDAQLAGLIADRASTPRAVALMGLLGHGFAIAEPGGELIVDNPPGPAAGNPPQAYLLYTSGSTGAPKGVAVSHANAAALLRAMAGVVQVDEMDRFTQFCELAFDFSIGEIFLCWQAGACLYVPSTAERMLPVHFVNRHGLTVWSSVPTVASNLHRLRALRPGTFPSLRLSMFCGEALPTRLAQAWHTAAPASALVNLYGPTEATVFATAYHFDPGQPPDTDIVPLGEPFPDMGVRIAAQGDDSAVGELLLSGPQVVDGYWRNPEATANAFVCGAGAAANGIWYRTGDLVSRDARHGLLFHGRCDDQVKLRGHRVQLAEIECVLRQLAPGAMVAVVPVSADGGFFDHVVAFCQRCRLRAAGPAGRLPRPAARLHGAASHRPDGAPAADPQWQDRLRPPVAAGSGRMLRRRPHGEPILEGRRTSPSPPAGDAMSTSADCDDIAIVRLQQVWCDLLRQPVVRVDDDFFALGGDSMLLVSMLVQAGSELDHDIDYAAFIATPTIRTLARLLAAPGPA